MKLNNLIKSKKKGFIFDFTYLIIMLFVLAIMFLAVFIFGKKTLTALEDSGQITGDALTIISNYNNKQAAIINGVYISIAIGTVIVVIILGYALRTMPFLAGFMILIMVAMGILAITFANSYFDLSQSNAVSQEAQQLTSVQNIMNMLPFFVIILGFIFIIVLLSGGSGGNQIPI